MLKKNIMSINKDLVRAPILGHESDKHFVRPKIGSDPLWVHEQRLKDKGLRDQKIMGSSIAPKRSFTHSKQTLVENHPFNNTISANQLGDTWSNHQILGGALVKEKGSHGDRYHSYD